MIKTNLGGVEFYTHDLKDDGIISKGVQEKHSYGSAVLACMCGMIKEGGTVFDVGSNIGCCTVPVSKKVGQTGRVVSCEPCIKNFNVLVSNVELNRLDNVDLLNVAVGDENSFVDVFSGNKSNMGDMRVFGKGCSRVGRTRMVTLDWISSFLGVVPDLIKVDTQGFEVAVLMGSDSLLLKRIPIVIEYCPQLLELSGYGYERFFSIVEKYGYVLKTLKGVTCTISKMESLTKQFLLAGKFKFVDMLMV